MKIAECHPEKKHAGHGMCRDCYHKWRYQTNAAARRQRKELKLLWDYGITLDQYQKMLDLQGGVCRICNRPPKNKMLAVDHCHRTGRVRGLLCWWCNNRVVPAPNTVDVLRKAIEYLESDFDGRTL